MVLGAQLNPPIGGRTTIEDVEPLVDAVTGSQLEVWQLSSGRFHGSLARARLGRVTVDSGRYTQAVRAEGRLSPTDVSIGMTLNECLWGDFNRRPLTDAGVEVFGADTEFTAHGPAGAEWASIVVSPDALERAALDIGRDPHLPQRGQTLEIGGADPAVQLLRQRTRQILAVACDPLSSSSAEAADRMRSLMDEELLVLAVLVLCKQPAEEKPTFQRRTRIVEEARRYMEEHRGRMVTLAELCRVTASSERALQVAFREVTDVSPTTYLRMRALHGARSDLFASRSDATVTEVATSWGFWHLGRFAGSYRRLFGEAPSETLQGSVPDLARGG